MPQFPFLYVTKCHQMKGGHHYLIYPLGNGFQTRRWNLKLGTLTCMGTGKSNSSSTKTIASSVIHVPLSPLERKITMGTCVSKRCSNPSPPFDSSPSQDKLVISQSLSKIETAPSSCSSSSSSSSSSSYSSSSSSSSSASSSASSSSSSSHSISSDSPNSRSSLKDRSFTNEFLLSCARENPHVIVLDPCKHGVTKPEPNKYPVRASPPPSKSVQGPQKQPIARPNQSLPSKHGRSSSPPILANRKSIKTELCSAVPPPSRSTNATSIRPRHEVGMSGNAVPLQLAARKEKKRGTCVHQIHQTHCQVGEDGSREVFSENSSRIPLMEDLNNPLISMDCFIFL